MAWDEEEERAMRDEGQGCGRKEKRECSCTIFLVQILLIRPWPKAQHTINLCRGWVKELSLSEFSRSDAWTTSLQKQKTQE